MGISGFFLGLFDILFCVFFSVCFDFVKIGAHKTKNFQCPGPANLKFSQKKKKKKNLGSIKKGHRHKCDVLGGAMRPSIF